MSKEEMIFQRPFIITFEGEPIGVFADPAGTLVIGDMHPRVQKQFRVLEGRIRAGMPK